MAAIPVVAAASSEEGSFASKINDERSSRSIATLSWNDELARVARRHSQEMADQNNLHHNAHLGNEVQGWQAVGENVGSGGSVDDLHSAFMNSTAHRDNILDRDYTELGVGTVWKDGTLWVTEVFMRPQGASSSGGGSGSGQPPHRHHRSGSSSSGSSSSGSRSPAPSSSGFTSSGYAPRSANSAGARPARPAGKWPGVPQHGPAATASTPPSVDLTRQMLGRLVSDDPAVGSFGTSILGQTLGHTNEGGVITIWFQPFANLVARVNRAILGR